MKLILRRHDSNKKQTLGRLQIYNVDTYKVTLIYTPNLENRIYTLELPDKGNQQNVSRIPQGIYQCKKRWSWKHKKHIQILDVPNRTWILIHTGNFYTDIRGCILIGDKLSDINNDGYQDVLNSKNTLKKILNLLPDRFELEIIDED